MPEWMRFQKCPHLDEEEWCYDLSVASVSNINFTATTTNLY